MPPTRHTPNTFELTPDQAAKLHVSVPNGYVMVSHWRSATATHIVKARSWKDIVVKIMMGAKVECECGSILTPRWSLTSRNKSIACRVCRIAANVIQERVA